MDDSETALLIATATRLIEDGRIKEARVILLQSPEDIVCNLDILLRLADLEAEDDNDDKALDYALQANSIDPMNADAVGAVLAIYRRLSRFREALSFIEEQPKEVLRNPIVRSEAGGVYHDFGWYARAVKAYGKRKYLDPGGRKQYTMSWLMSGGPLGFVREIVAHSETEAKKTWYRWSAHLQTLDKLSDVPEPARARIAAGLDLYLMRWSRHGYWWNRFGVVASKAAFFVGVALAWLTPFLLLTQVWHATVLTGISASFVNILPEVFVILCGNLIFDNAPSPIARIGAVVMGYGFLIGVGSLAVIYRPGDVWSLTTLGGCALLGIAAGSTLLPCVNFLIYWAEALDLKLLKTKEPRIAIIDHLLDVLYQIRESRRRNSFDDRSTWTWALEGAASVVESRLCKAYQYYDTGTTLWATERSAGAAAAIRDLKRLIVSSTPSSWSRLETALEKEVSALACGNFGSLIWKTPPSRVARFSHRWKHLGTTVIGAVLPIILVICVEPLLGIGASFYNWSKLIALAWLLLYILLTVDPSAKDKIAVARDLSSMIQRK